jgi:hypothetical protein
MELWADRFFFTARGEPIAGAVPPQNELVWWDADLLRETHTKGSIAKWKGAAIGSTQGSVQHVASRTDRWATRTCR